MSIAAANVTANGNSQQQGIQVPVWVTFPCFVFHIQWSEVVG